MNEKRQNRRNIYRYWNDLDDNGIYFIDADRIPALEAQFQNDMKNNFSRFIALQKKHEEALEKWIEENRLTDRDNKENEEFRDALLFCASKSENQKLCELYQDDLGKTFGFYDADGNLITGKLEKIFLKVDFANKDAHKDKLRELSYPEYFAVLHLDKSESDYLIAARALYRCDDCPESEKPVQKMEQDKICGRYVNTSNVHDEKYFEELLMQRPSGQYYLFRHGNLGLPDQDTEVVLLNDAELKAWKAKGGKTN